MRRRFLAVAAALLLSGCAQTPPRDVPVPPALAILAVPVPCPPLKSWSADDQVKLAQALQALPDDSILTTMALDWRRMRKDAQACRDAQKGG